MRIKLMNWINSKLDEKERCIISYNESVNDALDDRTGDVFEVIDIKISVGLKNAKKELEDPEVHKRWKTELEYIADLRPQQDRPIKFEADVSIRTATPDNVEIALGVNADELLRKISFLLTVNIYKIELIKKGEK